MDDEVKKLKEMNLRYNSEIRGLEGKEVERLNTILTLVQLISIQGDRINIVFLVPCNNWFFQCTRVH